MNGVNIHEAAENYLERVLIISGEKENVRQADICAAMGHSRPTVSVALRELAQAGYLDISPAGNITLTKSGRKIAEAVYERHCNIAKFFMILGTGEETAYADACKIEHYLSEESYERIKEFLRNKKNGR